MSPRLLLTKLLFPMLSNAMRKMTENLIIRPDDLFHHRHVTEHTVSLLRFLFPFCHLPMDLMNVHVCKWLTHYNEFTEKLPPPNNNRKDEQKPKGID
jgi:hypothetical protein